VRSVAQEGMLSILSVNELFQSLVRALKAPHPARHDTCVQQEQRTAECNRQGDGLSKAFPACIGGGLL
jgi:hypothetical protein